MNKKTLGALVLTMTIGAALLPLSADAAQEAQTGVGIGFSTGPDTPIPGPYDDALSLVNRPTAFNFGKTNEVSASIQSYNQELKGEQHIGVFEDRPDAEMGKWKVTAQMDKLMSKDGEAIDATLIFNSKTIKTFEIARDEDGKLPTEIDSMGALTAYTEDKVKGFDRVELKSGGDSQVFMEATDAAGKGGFATSIKNVQLRVAGGQEAKINTGRAYTSAVNWSIDDTK